MITRKLGRILRGDATPFQIFAACVLAAVLGFMPGLAQAPGLIVVFTLLIILLNANLALAALVGLGLKLVALVMTPVTFSLGRFLLDGPTQPLFVKLINAPVFALFGFDYYVTTGGLVLGLALGALTGTILVRAMTVYRKKMAGLESDSEAYKKFASKGWVKLMTFVFVGGKRKKSYDDILTKKVGNPIRPLGVIFVILFVVLLVIVQQFAAGPIVTAALKHGLERANGATVDLEDAALSFKENRLVLSGLAVADPNNLSTDLFRAGQLEADISGLSLLTKRLALDKVTIRNAAHGEPRRTPGQLVGRPPEPSPAPPADPALPDSKTLDDYLKDARVWKERLAQAKKWIEKLGGSDEPPAEPGSKKETLRERLAREVREMGHARVRASHLVQGAPTLTITELEARQVRVTQLKDQTLDITATNLSTHPRLLGQTPRVTIRSSGDTLGLDLKVGALGGEAAGNVIDLFCKNIAVDAVASQLKVAGQQPLSGGTLDLAAKGDWISKDGVTVNLPIEVALRNTTLTVPGASPTQVDHFLLPIGVRGPLDNPRVTVDDQQLASALVKAGVSRAKQELTDKATEKIKSELGDKVGEQGKGLLDGILKPKK